MEMENIYLTNTIDVQEIPEIDHFHEESDDNDDTLSLCDLPLHGGENDVDDDDDNDPVLRHSSSPSDPVSNFEFSTSKALHNTDTEILFFGKSTFPYRSPQTTSSFSHNKLEQKTTSRFHVRPTPPPRRSSSVRLPETVKFPYQTGGIKSSSKQYNYKVFIGFAAKFDPPRMELGEMRKRQSRRAPSTMFTGFGGEQPVVGGGERGGRKGHWGGFLRPLRFRSNLMSALTRVSFGCVQHV